MGFDIDSTQNGSGLKRSNHPKIIVVVTANHARTPLNTDLRPYDIHELGTPHLRRTPPAIIESASPNPPCITSSSNARILGNTHLTNRMASHTPSPIINLLSTQGPDLAGYEEVYKHFHTHPELSFHEAQTAKTISTHPALAPFKIHSGIGGHGVAAVLDNGPGPTILLRADTDALPVLEKTGLPYASKAKMVDPADGLEKPVMHACGHDMHITCLLAAAEWLSSQAIRPTWAGTLVLVFQPAEERGRGAKAMVDHGLYNIVPIPDVVLGQHVMAFRAGKVGVRKGTMMAAADSFKITLFGRGGHGSMPHLCIDPVVLAANVVVRLQGIVAREVDPQEFAVVTVGSLQAGDTENVIAEKAVLMVDIRSQNEKTRGQILKAVERVVVKECEASGCEKKPLIEETRRFPLTLNDGEVTGKLSEAFSEVFGKEFIPDFAASNASEDVSVLATSVGKPCCFWFFGGTQPEVWDKASKEGRIAQDVPANHSAYFAPVIQPTLRIGTEALCAAALTFLGSKSGGL